MLRGFVLSITCGVLAAAQQAPLPAGNPPTTSVPTMRSFPDATAPARVGVGITQRKLSLQEAVALALENNLDIEIERSNRDTAVENLEGARGFFDPSFRWSPLYQLANTPTGSILQGAGGKLTDRGFAQTFTFRQQLPQYGTGFHVDFDNTRLSTTNPFTSFNPAVSTRLLAGVTQPLVRGFRNDRNRSELRIRKRRIELADINVETRVIDVVTRVQEAYWNLVASRQDVAVGEESANLAREQLAINQRLVNAGTLAPVELAAAEAELQRRLDTWYTSVGALTEAENELKALIAPERISSLWNDEILPTEVKTAEPLDGEDLTASVKTALARRPELRNVDVRRQINDVEKALNADLRKPEVNLVGQYSLSGLGGAISSTANPFSSLNSDIYQRLNVLSAGAGLNPVIPSAFGGPPEFLVGGYGTSLSNLFQGNYQSFQAGISIDFNFRNRTAGANYGASLVAEKRLRLERARAEQTIEAQVRNALQGIQTSHQRIAAAEASTRAAKEKLDSEQRLYQTGESTNFLVLTRQNEYADSRRREVLAQLELNRSVARLQQATGITLPTYQITIKK